MIDYQLVLKDIMDMVKERCDFYYNKSDDFQSGQYSAFSYIDSEIGVIIRDHEKGCYGKTIRTEDTM